MDAAQYLPMFIAECRENLQELNLAIVRLEEHPEDRETIDAIFRIAHSLKGMSGTMGFDRIARLTHAMEDVFELLRDRQGGVGQEAIDVVLACLDALSTMVDDLDAEGVEKLDPETLIKRLHGLVRDGDVAENDAAASDEVQSGWPNVPDLVARADGRRLVEVRVTVADESPMPTVRIFMAMDALGKAGEVLAASPSEEELEGYGGRAARFLVATEAADDEVGRALEVVGEIASVEVSAALSGDGVASSDQLPEAEDRDGRSAGSADRLNVSPAAEEPAEAEAARTDPGARKRTSSTVRVDADRLDQLMHLMGELVVQRTRLEAIAAGTSIPGLSQAIQDLTRSSQALQTMVMQVRMIPVEAVFLRFPRLVRDLSTKLGKKVELILEGQETELDRSAVEALGDPLVHLVRNALDHGLEGPEERRASGKPEVGKLEISARHAGGSVLITVRDDGRGIDPAKVAAAAVKRGLISPEAAPMVDMARAIELLFTPGFSTAEQTTDLSGRGVGMDAVRNMVRAVGGDVVLESEPGVGTTAQVRLPLTLAIIAALLVTARGVPFALPLDRVERTFRLSEQVVRSVAGGRVIVLREAAIPLVDLAEALGYGPAEERTHAVLIRGADRRFALEVESLEGQRELVTRPLPEEVAENAGLSGGAVLSNGEIALVVDCDALVGAAAGHDLRLPLVA